MKKFLIETGLFLIIFMVICVALNITFKEQFNYSGNTVYTQKEKFFLERKAEFNTVFLGSSRIYRQLNPLVVDSILSHQQISGFNLAAPATFNPEVYILYEKLIRNNQLNLRYAFIELHPLAVIAPENIGTRKNYYFADQDYLTYSFDYIGNSNRNSLEKIYLYSTYFMSYLLRQVSLPAFHDLTKSAAPFPNRQNGFYSLTRELEYEKIPGLERRTNQFFKDTSELGERVRSSKRWFTKERESEKINSAHVNRLRYLIELSKKHGIDLFFIIPPRHTDYSEIIDLKHALPENRVIELANYESYPKLYESLYSFDIGHLNEQGSILFSAYFANRLNEIINKGKTLRITDSVNNATDPRTN